MKNTTNQVRIVQDPVEILYAFRDAHFNAIVLAPTDKVPAMACKHKYKGKFYNDHDMMAAQMGVGNTHWGVATGNTEYNTGLIVIDVDNLNDETTRWIDETLPETPLVVYSRRGCHYYYKSPQAGIHTMCRSLGPIGDDGHKHIDFKAGPGLVVAPGATNQSSGWTYRASVNITSNLLRSLPELPMHWIKEHVHTAGGHGDVTKEQMPVYMGKADGFSVVLDNGSKTIVAARKLPVGVWNKCMCPGHPSNTNTGHAGAFLDAQGNVRIRCFLDEVTYHYGAKELEPVAQEPPDLGINSSYVIQADNEDLLLQMTNMVDLVDHARRSVNYAKVLEWRFRMKWSNVGYTPPLDQCVGAVHLLKHATRNEHIHYPRPCNKLRCYWCGPRLLSTKLAAMCIMPTMERTSVSGAPMCDRLVYSTMIRTDDLAQWTRLFNRHNVDGRQVDRLAYAVSISTDTQVGQLELPTQVGQLDDNDTTSRGWVGDDDKEPQFDYLMMRFEMASKVQVHTQIPDDHAYVAFRMGQMTCVMTTNPVTAKQKHGTQYKYIHIDGRRCVIHHMVEMALLTYQVEVDQIVNEPTISGRITTSTNVVADPDPVRQDARDDVYTKVGDAVPFQEARQILGQHGVDYDYTNPVSPTDPEKKAKRGCIKARNLGQEVVDLLLVKNPTAQTIDQTDCYAMVDAMFNETLEAA